MVVNEGASVETGEIFRSSIAKDGRSVILRTPKWEDLDDLMEHINLLVEEGVGITFDTEVARAREADWLGRQLAEIEKGDRFILVAEVDGRVVANSSITKGERYSKHVGGLGIGIRKGYRDVGIGTEMLKTLISQAEKMGLKMLTLSVFSTNKRAIHVYKKVGLKETGRIPNQIYKNGKFIDHIVMVKQLTELT